MKKIFITIALVLVAHFAVAQDAFKADVRRMLEMSGSTVQADIAKKQIITMIPTDKHAEFTKEFDALLPGYYASFEDYYMKHYSHAEIKEMIKFYETPVGKKIKENAAPLAETTMMAVQDWGTKLQALMMKYMQK